MKRDAFTLPLAFPGELIIDNFAGGGGTSTGLEAAFGRPVDIAFLADGSMLVSDDMRGRIYRVTYKAPPAAPAQK